MKMYKCSVPLTVDHRTLLAKHFINQMSVDQVFFDETTWCQLFAAYFFQLFSLFFGCHDTRHNNNQDNDTQHKWHSITVFFYYAEGHILFIVMLNVIMLSFVMLNVIMLSVVMLNVNILSVIMLCIVVPWYEELYLFTIVVYFYI